MGWLRTGLAGLLIAWAAIARAQDLPEPMRLIVPWTAGSSIDARARVIAEAVGQRLRVRMIVENRPGAGGVIGAAAVAKSKPDGGTLMFTNNSHVISPHVYRDPGFDALKDFVPVAQGYVSGMVLVVHPSLRVSSVRELAALARNASPTLTYASSGSGGLPHLATEMFKRAAGIQLVHVPYRGDGQALTDLLSGRVPLMMSGYPVALPHVKAGKLRALAITSAQRTEIFPDVPTIIESGYPSYSLDVWTGFFAPAGTAAPLVDRLNRSIGAAMSTPAVQAHLRATGAQFVALSPREFAALVQRDWERYGKLVRELDLKAE